MLLLTGLSMLTTLLVPGAWFLPLANLFHVLAISLACYVAIVLFSRFREFGEWESGAAVLIGVLALGLGVHAMLIYFGVLDQHQPRLIRLVAPLLVLGFGAVLVARFIRAVAVADALNQELTARVAQKELALTVQFERLRQLEGAQLIEEERTRLMREMHDGMGGRLVSLLAMVEGGEPSRDLLSDNLKTALEELRCVVDSLDPDIGDLGMLLGVVRERLEPRLGGQGLKFRWRVNPNLAQFRLSPEDSLDVLRFVQECLTNVLKHAGAKWVTVETEVEEQGDTPHVRLAVEDDGSGFSEDRASGRGLTNLRRRAERLKGTMCIETSAQGTRVELRLPVQD